MSLLGAPEFVTASTSGWVTVKPELCEHYGTHEFSVKRSAEPLPDKESGMVVTVAFNETHVECLPHFESDVKEYLYKEIGTEFMHQLPQANDPLDFEVEINA